MASSPNPGAPAPKSRPGSVTISSYLLYLVAALQVVGLIVALAAMGTFTEIYEDAFAGTELEGSATTLATASLIGGAVVSLLVAVGLVVLALLNNRGKNASRIVTWVLGGLFFCCTGASLAVNAAGNSFMGDTGAANAPDQAEIQQTINERLPWYEPVSLVISIVALLALLGAMILLALPASNEFFKRPANAWEPPVPGSAYPGYPQGGGTSGTPGYPQGGGTPGYPQGGGTPGYPPQGGDTPGYPPQGGASGTPGYPPPGGGTPGSGTPGGSGPSGDQPRD